MNIPNTRSPSERNQSPQSGNKIGSIGTSLRTYFFGSKLWILIVLTGLYYAGYRNPDIWKLWGLIPYPHFLDASVIVSGAESVRNGYDPMYENPFDSRRRTMNYPRIWQSLALVLPTNSIHFLGFTFGALFFLGLFILFHFSKQVSGVLLFIIIFSPPVLLALERGNSDLLMFTLVAAAIAIQKRSGLLSHLLAFTAALLKLYPIFSTGYLLRARSRRHWGAILGLCVVFVVYELVNLADLHAIRLGTPDTMFGYGRSCIVLIAENSGITLTRHFWFFYVLALASPLCFLIGQIGGGPRNPSVNEDFFIAGAGIYLCTFLLGSNFSYRLIFLLLCLPALTRPIDLNINRLTARIALITLVLSMWSSTILVGLTLFIPSPVTASVPIQLLEWGMYFVLGGIWLQCMRHRLILFFKEINNDAKAIEATSSP